jgi:signal transduction histidine kinase
VALMALAGFRSLIVDALVLLAGAALLGWRRIHTLIREPYTMLQAELRTANRDLQHALSEVAGGRQRIEEMERELRAVSQSQTEYLVRMGHELRIPLNTIIGFSELLHEGFYGDVNPLQEDRLRRVHYNGLRLLAILDDILDLNRIDSGMLRLEPVAFQLGQVVEPVTEQIAMRCARKSLDLTVKLADNLPVLFGDETRIQQVIHNLLDNGIKFTDTGGITLSACYIQVKQGQTPDLMLPATGWLSDGDWVVLAVADTGMGIAPEDQGRIFNEFVQVNLTQRRSREGTGLGLTITRRLVEMHGGTIWVRSTPGEGSTFYVALPADVRIQVPEAIHTETLQ